MRISLSTTVKTVRVGDKFPTENLLKPHDTYPNESEFTLNEATQERYVQGEDVIILVDEYSVNGLRYKLTRAHGIQARIETGGILTPLLREATGQERNVADTKDGKKWWPKVVETGYSDYFEHGKEPVLSDLPPKI